ncbi:MAG: response regulator [Acidobacteriota bacterium]|nr:response regulator [Acidobacteriota bacterium]
MTTHTATVFIIEDEEEICQMLTTLLLSVDLKPLCFKNALEFLEFLEPDMGGCIITDVRMPGYTGLQLQEKLRERKCDLPLILITAFADVDMAVRAMRKGAFDFQEKPLCQQRLLDSVYEALALDGKRQSESLQKQAILDRASRLTNREREVMENMVVGCPNKVIAYNLGIAQSTVENHRARVMTKMHAESLADLVGMAYISGLVPSPMQRRI